MIGPWSKIDPPTPTPTSDWSTHTSPERRPEFPSERQVQLITPEQEPEHPPKRQVQIVTPVPSPTSSLKDFAASEDEGVATFNNLFPPQEYKGIKDVAFKKNPRACDNAIKRFKAIAFSAGDLMASEQQLKLEELLHLFRMESQNIFEKTWRTP